MEPDTDSPDPVERFRALYQEHYQDVHAYCRRRSHGAGAADDAVADTFTVAWRRLADVPAGDAARLWLFGTARRVLANQHRSARRSDRLRLRLVSTHERLAEWATDPVDASDVQPVVVALATLRPDDQEVLRLIAWEELSHAEAAVVLGCSTNAVAIRLHRARHRLTHAMDDRKPNDRSGHALRRGTESRREDLR